MRSFRCFALLALPLVDRVFAHELKASPTKEPEPIYADANQAFQDLLNALPEESLRVALNSLTKFQKGVFESDRHGVEHVHHENPPLATKLIVAAVQDLKKRQAPAPSNGTTPPTSTINSEPGNSQAPPSSEAPPASQNSDAVIVPVPVTTTDSNGQATVVSSAIISEATASVAVPVTLTDDDGSTFVSTATKPAVIFTATDSAGSAFVTTSAVDHVPTPGQVLTTTDSRGSTFLTTYTPGGGKVSSILLITTTDSNGQPSVITSYTFVEPGQPTGTDGQPLTGTNTGRPSLQTNAANKQKVIEMAALGGAALAWFI